MKLNMFKKRRIMFLLSLVLLLGNQIYSQVSKSYEAKIKSNEPNLEFPFGKRNPKAPIQLDEFSFMIGVCDCIDSIRTKKNEWISFPSIWEGKYFLNGYAIQDNYFNGENPTSNLRFFDPTTNTWKVTYTQFARGYFVGTWEGKKQGNNIVLYQEQKSSSGKKVINRLTFYNISDTGYDWVSEAILEDNSVTANWKQSCKKRK